MIPGARVNYNGIPVPEGERLMFAKGYPVCPDRPIIPVIEGDIVGPEVWKATRRVLDAAVANCYGGERQIAWYPVAAGDMAKHELGSWWPEDSLEAVKFFGVLFKGPLQAQINRGLVRNLKQHLNLYAGVRTLRYFGNNLSALLYPHKFKCTIFRDITEDYLSGLELGAGSTEADMLLQLLTNTGFSLPADAALSVRLTSKGAAIRLARRSFHFGHAHDARSIIIAHDAHIQRHTDESFKEWIYAVAEQEFRGAVLTKQDIEREHEGGLPPECILLRDQKLSLLFSELIAGQNENSIILCQSQHGDLLSDFLQTLVCPPGTAHGALLGDDHAVFETMEVSPTLISQLEYANPLAMILAGTMLLDFLGWKEAAVAVNKAVSACLQKKMVTPDLEPYLRGAIKLKSADMATAIIDLLVKA